MQNNWKRIESFGLESIILEGKQTYPFRNNLSTCLLNSWQVPELLKNFVDNIYATKYSNVMFVEISINCWMLDVIFFNKGSFKKNLHVALHFYGYKYVS